MLAPALCLLAGLLAGRAAAAPARVRVGYFLGGRTNAILRALAEGDFAREGVEVDLYTANLHETSMYKVPDTFTEIVKLRKKKKYANIIFSKIRGGEVLDAMARGEVDAGTVGESSFIEAVGKGQAVVAVALLGFDARGRPAHAIAIRSDEVIKSTADFRGKILATRRAGNSEYVFLKEFLRSIGLENDPTVKIVSQVADDQIEDQLRRKEVDGGYYHIATVMALERDGLARVYRPLDWADPEMSQALLVVRKDFLENNRDAVSRLVTAYVRRVAYEKTIPPERADRTWRKSTMMRSEFAGMMVPQYALPPRVSPGPLEAMQALLLRYGFIKKPADLSAAIDNRFVDGAMETLKERPIRPYRAR